MNIIGLCGYKRSGKDTAGSLLLENGYTKYSFAGPLKKACQEIFMFDDEQTEGNKKEDYDDRWNINPRKVFQRFGTEIFRDNLDMFFPEMKNIKNTFWIYRFKLWYKKEKEKNPNIKIVVTDVRFENEANIIKELGGLIIKVNRNNNNNNDNHISELSINKIKHDILIDNDSTIEDFHLKLKKILKFK